MENKVIAFIETGKVEVRDAPMPELGANDILVHIKATALCTQEQRVYTGVKTPAGWPAVGGHESAGIVVEVGEAVTNVKVGDHVAIAGGMTPPSGKRIFKGEPKEPDADGFYRYQQGSLRRYLVRNEYDVIVSPRKADFKYLGLTEPISCVLGSVNRANVQIGQTAVIIGAGIMGLLHVQILKMRGAQIIVSEIDADRVEKAKKFGADFVINPQEEDVVARVKELTDGAGADVVFNTTAITANWEAAIAMAARNGKVIAYSSQHPDTPVPIAMGQLHNNCTQLIGTIGGTPYEQYIACKLIERGALNLDDVIDSEYDFEDATAAFDRATTPGVYRVIITDNLVED